jgi:glycogen operon protein
MDLFSYNEKHNEANGEDNRDGSNDNDSWNCGAEGETGDPAILALRRQLIRNAWAILMVSRGVPMVLMGDECGRTQMGNNNSYCLDSEISWLDWSLGERDPGLLRFARLMTAFRRAHKVLREPEHPRNADVSGSGYPDLSWHGTSAWNADWSADARLLAFMLCGAHLEDDFIYVGLNSHWEALSLELPQLPDGRSWHVAVNTAMPSPLDIFEPGSEPSLGGQGHYLAGARSAIILVGR